MNGHCCTTEQDLSPCFQYAKPAHPPLRRMALNTTLKNQQPPQNPCLSGYYNTRGTIPLTVSLEKLYAPGQDLFCIKKYFLYLNKKNRNLYGKYPKHFPTKQVKVYIFIIHNFLVHS